MLLIFLHIIFEACWIVEKIAEIEISCDLMQTLLQLNIRLYVTKCGNTIIIYDNTTIIIGLCSTFCNILRYATRSYGPVRAAVAPGPNVKLFDYIWQKKKYVSVE